MGVGFDVDHGFVELVGFGAVEVVAAGGGGDRFDGAVTEVGEPLLWPGGGVGDAERE